MKSTVKYYQQQKEFRLFVAQAFPNLVQLKKENDQASFNSLDKNDGIDSFVIADFARVGRITIKPWRGSQYLALQRLTRHRLHISECIAKIGRAHV